MTETQSKAEKATVKHFLGTIVVQQVPTATRDIDQREVIDGQQRMTTMQLLLDATQQVCEKLELGQNSYGFSKLVANDDKTSQGRELSPRLQALAH